MALDSGSSDEIIGLKYKLRQMYIEAESLMLNKKNFPALRDFPKLNQHFEKLIEVCESFKETEIIPGTNWCRKDIVKEKQEFDSNALSLLTKAMSLETLPVITIHVVQ